MDAAALLERNSETRPQGISSRSAALLCVGRSLLENRSAGPRRLPGKLSLDVKDPMIGNGSHDTLASLLF